MTKDKELMDSLFPYKPEYFDELTVHVLSEEELQDSELYMEVDDVREESSRIANSTVYAQEQVNLISEDLENLVKIEGSNCWVISGNYTK